MIRPLFALLLFLGAVLVSESAEALRCGTRLITVDDAITRVERHCPEPFWIETWQGPELLVGDYRYGYTEPQYYEAWYINLGSRKLMRRLVFLNGYLQREETLDYGFNTIPRRGSCSPRDLTLAGDSLAKVYAHCGPPDHESSYPITVYPRFNHRDGRRHRGGAITIIRHVWTYRFNRQKDRELHFEDGRLIKTRTLKD